MAKHSQKTDDSRRNFAKSVAISLGAIPLVSLIVSEQGCKTHEQKREIRQTSPIIVGGGGSVTINFDEGYYTRVPGTNKFINTKGDYLHKLRILNRYSAPSTPADPTPKNPDSRIVIHCVDPKSVEPDSLIIIYGNPMGVEFDTKRFELKSLPDTPEPVRFNPRLMIGKKIQVFEGTVTIPTAEHNVPTEGICTIDVLDKF